MNRIKELFQNKKEKILNIYFTAGYPQLDDTTKILMYLQEAGVDMVEIGIPFSDPLADGPTIQSSSQQALKNGMSLKVLLQQLKGIREKIHLPIVLMGYYNPILQFGLENFLIECKEIGIDGLILPDLPLSEFEKQHKSLFEEHGIANILLVTPETTESRIRKIDALGSGFIYAVSSSSTTGTDKDWEIQEAYFKRLQDLDLSLPILIGFGVKDKDSFEKASRYTQGAIIGTAFIKTLQHQDTLRTKIKDFLQEFR